MFIVYERGADVRHFPFRTLLCASLAFIFLLPGCGGERAPSGAVHQLTGGTPDLAAIVNVGNGTEPEGLDPHIVTGIPEHHILLTLFEGLVRLNPEDLTIVPGMAESWDVSDDRRVYTFHLRDNAKWSNGDPLTAKDFAYAWRRMLTPALASEYAYMLYPMENAQAYNEGKLTDFAEVGAKVIDDRTLEVTLTNPTPYFLSMHAHYSWWPVHQATIEKHGKLEDRVSKWTRPENFVGNGPYLLAAWRPNDAIEARPNPHYWDAAGMKNAGVNFYPVSDENTEERMFRAGELHFTENVPLSKIGTYEKRYPEMYRADAWIGSYFYRVNTTRPPMNDVRVRKALAMAVDRESLCKNVVRGGETPAPFLTPPNINGYLPSARVQYDVAAARKLLAEAGYPDGKDFPSVDILYNTLDKHKIIAEAIQQMWKQNLNIDVTLTNQDWKVYLASTANNTLDYDLARAGWIGDIVDPINFLECFITNNGNNRTGWGNPEYDRLLAQTMTTESNEERNKLFDQAETILVAELPIIPLYHYTRPFLIQPEVRGLYPNILAYYAYHKVYIAKAEG